MVRVLKKMGGGKEGCRGEKDIECKINISRGDKGGVLWGRG